MKKLIVWFLLSLFPFMLFAQSEDVQKMSDNNIDFTVSGKGKNNLIFLFADDFDDEEKKSVQNLTENNAEKLMQISKITAIFLQNEKSDECWLRNFPENHSESVFYYTKKINCGSSAGTSKKADSLITFFQENTSSFPSDKTIVFLIRKNIENVYVGNYSPLIQNCILQLKKNGIKNICPEVQIDGTLSLWLEKQYGIPMITVPFELFEKLNSDYFVSLFKSDILKELLKKDDDSDFFKQLILQTIPSECKITNKNKEEFFSLLEKCFADPQLLLLPNKKHSLSEKYVPEDMECLDGKGLSPKQGIKIRRNTLNALIEMTNAAKDENCNLQVISAFRSYNTQQNVFMHWVKEFGLTEAQRISARPGTSQHQLGTAIDFNLLDEAFEKYPEGKWLADNAYKYGFIMSFPKGMEYFTGYSYEPWHYRYIGKEAALLVHNFFDKNLELFLQWYWSLWQPL